MWLRESQGLHCSLVSQVYVTDGCHLNKQVAIRPGDQLPTPYMSAQTAEFSSLGGKAPGHMHFDNDQLERCKLKSAEDAPMWNGENHIQTGRCSKSDSSKVPQYWCNYGATHPLQLHHTVKSE